MRLEQIMDANVNRVAEGTRVVEDYVRFVLKNEALSNQLRNLKHEIRKVSGEAPFMMFRDVENDIGVAISLNDDNKRHRTSAKHVLACNFGRVQEGLRSLEETSKALGNFEWSKEYERLRFESYAIEKSVMRIVGIKDAFSSKVYGISYPDVRGFHLPSVEKMVAGGIGIIQYREKEREKVSMDDVCAIRELTQSHGVKLIINDDVALALLVGADGVHLGQDDVEWERLPLIQKHLIVGISTHNLDEGNKAASFGADYIGFGPMFATTSKPDHSPVKTIADLEQMINTLCIPIVAIGGLNRERIRELPPTTAAFAMIGELRDTHSIPDLINYIAKGEN